jgi:hypothetical protein
MEDLYRYSIGYGSAFAWRKYFDCGGVGATDAAQYEQAQDRGCDSKETNSPLRYEHQDALPRRAAIIRRAV